MASERPKLTQSPSSALASVRAARLAAGAGTTRKPFTSKFRTGGSSVLDSLSSIPTLSVLDKKPSIVLEIGAAYTKVGFSGEPMPRHVIPTTVETDGITVPVFDPEEKRSKAELKEVILTFLHEIMYKKLLVKTTDRRVVICEGVAVPTVYRTLLADILYRCYMFQSVLFAPNPVLATLPVWLDSALVVDVGYTETTVVAVFDGVAAINTFNAVSAGAVEMHKQIREALKAKSNELESATVDGLDESALEDIKVRACVAGKLPEGKQLKTFQYPLRAGSILTLDSDFRATALDPIFEGVGSDANSIPRAILETLSQCPCDTRKMLAKRILVTGGGCMLPGFKHRVLTGIYELIKEDEFAELAGTSLERTVLTVKISRVGMDNPSVQVNKGTYDRLLDEVVRRYGDLQVSSSSAKTEEGNIVLVIISPDEVDVAKLENAKINMGQTSFVVTDVTTENENRQTGVGQLFSFVKVDFPENILNWLGGSIIGGLESLPEASLSKESYLKNPSLPDWSDLRPRCQSVKKVDAKTPSHARWKVMDRPRAWGCGSLNVVDTKKKTDYPQHEGYVKNGIFAANPILHVQ